MKYDREGLLSQIVSMFEQLDERDTQLAYVWDVYNRDVLKLREARFRSGGTTPSG